MLKTCSARNSCVCFVLAAAACAIILQVFTREGFPLHDLKATRTTKAEASKVPLIPVAPMPRLFQATAAPRMAVDARGECQLPAGARWSTVQLRQLATFKMAVYAGNDIVSQSVTFRHNWEQLDVKRLGKPGHACDIGGNIGFYTFALAKAGWNVTTFEAMPSNVDLMRATLCANPDLADRVDLHAVGLGDAPGRCRLMSDTSNVGDGIVVCSTAEDPTKQIPVKFAFRTEFEVKLFDNEFRKGRFAELPISFVKIDVEGFECKVFRGASELLKQKPHLIQSEVWGTMQGCSPAQYMKLFTDVGYHIKADASCSLNADMNRLPVGRNIRDYWMCHD